MVPRARGASRENHRRGEVRRITAGWLDGWAEGGVRKIEECRIAFIGCLLPGEGHSYFGGGDAGVVVLAGQWIPG